MAENFYAAAFLRFTLIRRSTSATCASIAGWLKPFCFALRASEVKAKLAEQGSEPVGNTQEEFRAFIASELVKWRRLVEVSGAMAQ